MKYLYLLLNLGSVLVPFIASFHPRLKFYKKWKLLIISLFITNIIFIPWDIWFTKMGVWGFNPDYYLGEKIFELPIEEWLFFICIPYACVFMHYSLLELYPKWTYSKGLGNIITLALFLMFALLLVFNYNKWYPLVNYGLAIVILMIVYFKNKSLLFQYYKTFLIMLIPFFLVNGVLTGTGIDKQVVWYNNNENLGVRILTIPFEDITYAFSLILLNLILIKFLEKKCF
ncbi:lycopene cyclase domain-containing protein [Pseudofulvibacter geojedonensis]|uniref:Lycopene cyclase domain-containing protein n=1 Tax=Pseudofulvibacter geojedonensis TaxID=1123758 RepID=A0ABW3I2D8_9FLAO